jgi:hypothetical protein
MRSRPASQEYLANHERIFNKTRCQHRRVETESAIEHQSTWPYTVARVFTRCTDCGAEVDERNYITTDPGHERHSCLDCRSRKTCNFTIRKFLKNRKHTESCWEE